MVSIEKEKKRQLKHRQNNKCKQTLGCPALIITDLCIPFISFVNIIFSFFLVCRVAFEIFWPIYMARFIRVRNLEIEIIQIHKPDNIRAVSKFLSRSSDGAASVLQRVFVWPCER